MSRRRRDSPRRPRGVLVFVLLVSMLAAGGAVLYAKWQSADSGSPVLTVRYRTGAPATTAVAKPWLEIINTSGKTVDLSDVTLRYYYSADGDSAYGSNCVQPSLGCSGITQKTRRADGPSSPDADHYLQIGFTAAARGLAPGSTSEGIGLQLYRVDHRTLNQANDRSYNAEDTTYTPSKRVTAYVRGALVWGQEPDGSTPVPGRSPAAAGGAAVAAPPSGVFFDDFDYTGPGDPALAANGWQARSGEGGPGIKDTWSADGVSFPAGEAGEDGEGGQALRLRAETDGTASGTRQAEFHRTGPTVFTGTLVARVYLSDTPAGGSDGDHIAESFFTISPDPRSSRYSELDYEYMPNGGWGALGPRLDTTSWRSNDLTRSGDRVTSSHIEKLGG